MPQQYVASDHQTGLEVQVTGEFPEDPDDRVRIARTTNLFTRLMSTILSTANDTERRERFKAIETQLEIADALIRGNIEEVQRLIRETLGQMGITDEQLADVERQLREQLEAMGAEGFEGLFTAGGTLSSEQEEPVPEEPLAQPREDWLPDEEPGDPAAEAGDESSDADETGDEPRADDEADTDQPGDEEEPGQR